MNQKQLEDLVEDVRAISDHMTIIDQVLKANKIGREMVMVFQCNHSGLYFPADYIRQWGRRYGVGLGPSPVSEVLDTDYDVAPPEITPAIRSIDQIMHPVGHCLVQVDLHLVDADEYAARPAICSHEDPYMEQRGRVVRLKQLENPRGRLRVMQAAWERRLT